MLVCRAAYIAGNRLDLVMTDASDIDDVSIGSSLDTPGYCCVSVFFMLSRLYWSTAPEVLSF